jgi:nitrogen regulatory protein P-II 1
MKKIEAVIRRSRLDAVKNALSERGLLHGMTLAEALGAGSERGREIMYRGNVRAQPFVPRVKLEIVTSDDEAESVVTCILDAAYTGEVGDGKILVSSVERVFRIRNGEEVTDFCMAANDEASSPWRESALRPSF